MRLVLDGMTAFEFWMSAALPDATRRDGARDIQLTSFDGASSREISRAISRCSGSDGPLHILVASDVERRDTKFVKCHVLCKACELPANSIYQVGAGLYVESPELCLVRLAAQLPRLELLRAATEMLGIYGHSILDRESLCAREPVTNIARIREYLKKLPRMRGRHALADALGNVVENVASPREASVDLCLCMDTRMGGQNLPRFEANPKEGLTDEARLLTTKAWLSPDVYWRRSRLALEFNSSTYHDIEDALEHDLEKITAMQSMGVTVIPLSTRQFVDYGAFSAVVASVRRVLGVRTRASADVENRRQETHGMLLSIERRRRRLPSLCETARWRYLIPRVDFEG